LIQCIAASSNFSQSRVCRKEGGLILEPLSSEGISTEFAGTPESLISWRRGALPMEAFVTSFDAGEPPLAAFSGAETSMGKLSVEVSTVAMTTLALRKIALNETWVRQ